MDNNHDFEEKIRVELKKIGKGIEPSCDLFSGIMTELSNNKKGRLIMLKDKLVNMGTKKVAAAILCFTIAIGVISFSTSGNLRAFAAETLDKIKTIFVLDSSSKVVERDATKYPFPFITSKGTELSDAELSKKVGFKVAIPDNLGDNYKLLGKSESIQINNIDYIEAQRIQKDACDAIDNIDKFHSLEKYNPARGVNAMYKKADDMSIFVLIDANTASGDFEKQAAYWNAKIKIVDIKGIKAYWLDVPFPVYPIVTKDGVTQSDMTQKPTSIETSHQLDWFSNNLHFSIGILPNQDYSMQEIENCAKVIIDAYAK